MTKDDIKDLLESKKDLTFVCIDKNEIKKKKLCRKSGEFTLIDEAYNRQDISSIEILDDYAIKAGNIELLILGTLNE